MYGAYLRAEREKRGYSVAAAAARIGVSSDAVYKYEADKNSPSMETLDRIAAAYGCLVGDLLPNSGGGAVAEDYEPLQAALSGLTRNELRDYILLMASQARLFRNAVAARESSSGRVGKPPDPDTPAARTTGTAPSLPTTLLSGGLSTDAQEDQDKASSRTGPLGGNKRRKGGRR